MTLRNELSKPMVHILVPVYNRAQLTSRFIDCLERQTYRDFRLILVDDGSTDGTADMARQRMRNLVVITGKGNWWWGGGLYQAMSALQREDLPPGDVIMISNDDDIIGEDFLETGVSELQGVKRTLVLATECDRETGQRIGCGGGVHFDTRWLRFAPTMDRDAVNCTSDRGLFMRWGDCLEIGNHYPRLLPHYFSDYEYTYRAHRKGFRIMVSEKLKILSTGHAPSGWDWPNLATLPPAAYLRTLFCRRCRCNPITWSAFVLAAYSPIRIPGGLLIVWLRTGRMVLRYLMGKQRPARPPQFVEGDVSPTSDGSVHQEGLR